MNSELETIVLSQSYQVEVKETIEEETENRKGKYHSQSYLIEAYSVTECEAKIALYYKDSPVVYNIASVKTSKIKDILR